MIKNDQELCLTPIKPMDRLKQVVRHIMPLLRNRPRQDHINMLEEVIEACPSPETLSARDRPWLGAARRMLGQILLSLGRPVDAIMQLEIALDRVPRRRRPQVAHLIVLCHIKMETWGQAIPILKDLADHVRRKCWKTKCLCTLAFCYIHIHDYENALGVTHRCLDIDPKKADAWRLRARAFNCIEDLESALACVNKGLALCPDNTEMLEHRSRLCFELEIYEESLSDALHLIELTDATRFRVTAAFCLYALGRPESALNMIAKGRCPTVSAMALCALGRTSEAMSEEEKAFSALRRDDLYGGKKWLRHFLVFARVHLDAEMRAHAITRYFDYTYYYVPERDSLGELPLWVRYCHAFITDIWGASEIRIVPNDKTGPYRLRTGRINGPGKVFAVQDDVEDLIYSGGLKDGLPHGVGTEFDAESGAIIHEGEYAYGLRLDGSNEGVTDLDMSMDKWREMMSAMERELHKDT